MSSQLLFSKAQTLIPGGVNSPVRAFKGVGGEPIFFEKGQGAYLIDVDARRYIDYVGSWGALILGHCDPQVVRAIQLAVNNGTSFGAPTELEIKLAQKIIKLMPAIEKIRFVNSGTEATMTAIRLARGFTGKNKIIKFNGCYHGHSDSLLVKAGSGLLTMGIPSTPGILPSVAEHTLIAEFNDLEQVAALCEHYKDDIAAIIIEPIAGNMGMVRPTIEFLTGLRYLCSANNALLIFDEVMTGFRVALGGAQGLFGITPDLTTLGKIIGGGLPVGALGGRAEIMSYLAPEGAIYQAGTLSGNPLTMAAGLATLDEVEQPDFYANLAQYARTLLTRLAEIMAASNLPFCYTAEGGMFGFCFNARERILNYHDIAASNLKIFQQFFHGMLAHGVYFAPSMYEAGFVSSAHQAEELELTLAAAEVVVAKMIFNTSIPK